MRRRLVVNLTAALLPLALWGGTPAVPWDLEALSKPPRVYEDSGHSTADVRAVFYDGVPWHGQPTRVFAYIGIPKDAVDGKTPAMVLVHGGGGSAFIPWVRLWVDRGYAALAMDTCGCISGGGYRNHPRHEHGGPPGWGGFDQVDEPVQDQWTYHAVAAVILGHSLIRSLPQVDPERTGITGISWGGYLTCIVAGLDPRFKFAVPVYGCGFLGDNSTWLGRFKKMGQERAAEWLARWDPSVYLPNAQMPMLWVAGTNDFAYPMDSWQKSYRLPQGPRFLCLRVRMPHGHGGPGENPPEIRGIADAVLKNGMPLARITDRGRRDRQVWVRYEAPTPIVEAVLNYTTAKGNWKERRWETVPAALDPQAKEAKAALPAGTTVYCFNLKDSRGLLASSEHEEIPAEPASSSQTAPTAE